MSITDIQQLQSELIRKATTGSVFLADSSAEAISEDNLFDPISGDLVALPDGYDDLGYLTTAGAQFSRAITQSDVTSWQSQSATRSDITADTDSLQVACQETKLATIGLYLNVDKTQLTPGTNGVVSVDKPAIAGIRTHRVLSVAVDLDEDGEIVIARFLPRAQVSNYDAQNFAQGDDPILWPVTLTGKKDDELGTAGRYLFGGAGWAAKLAAMGFTPTAAAPIISSAEKANGGGLNLATAGGQLVHVAGRGFTGTTGVKFAGTAAPEFDVVSDTRLDVVSPAHAAGSGPIVVTNATGPSTTGPTATYA